MLSRTALLVVPAAAVLAVTACGDGKEGSGVEATDKRTVPGFTAVELSGVEDAVVSVGKPRAVAVRGDDNLLGDVKTEVRDGTLEISDDEDLAPKAGTTLQVSVPRLTAIGLSGAGNVTARGIKSDPFRAELSGAGGVRASGHVRRLEVDLSGAGDASLQRLVAKEATVDVSGVGDVHVFASDSLMADVSGVGDVVYSGEPRHVTKDVSGDGDVRAQ
jgi:hypothetical protein